MFNKAISKIKDEMSKNQNNGYIQAVGGMLLQHLEANPAAAEKIMAADKTIAKSLDKMREAANKKKTGNYAVLSDSEGFAVVLNYFGIDAKAQVAAATPAPAAAADFDVKLEDLL